MNWIHAKWGEGTVAGSSLLGTVFRFHKMGEISGLAE
jgi:hypothetical protein